MSQKISIFALVFEKAGFEAKKPAWFLKKHPEKSEKMPIFAPVFEKAQLQAQKPAWFLKKQVFFMKKVWFLSTSRE